MSSSVDGAPGTSTEALTACGRLVDGRIELCDEVAGRAEVTIERRRLGGHDEAADEMAAETRSVLAEHCAKLDGQEPPA